MIGVFKGLMTTLSTAMRKPVTIEYPDERHILSERQRSFPILLWDFEHDQPFCTGCNICVRNCPVDCMTAVMTDNPKFPTGEMPEKKKVVEKFWIDYARCMRCNICVEVCPFEAIAMDNTWGGHEHAVYDRRDLHMDIDELLKPNKSGELTNPFFPYDNIARLDKALAGEELPLPSAQGARPAAREQWLVRKAQEEADRPAGLAAGATTAAAAAPVGDPNSPRKIRARRMRAERAAREEGAAQGLAGAELEAFAKAAGETAVAGMKSAATATATAAPAAGGGGATAGDPNSPRKLRARRMRAERAAREEGAAQGLSGAELDAFATAAGQAAIAGAGGAAAAPAAAAGAAPVLLDAEGNPLSANKLRARRMRAERTAREEGTAQGLSGDALEAFVTAAGDAALGIVPGAAAAPEAAAPAKPAVALLDAEGNPLSENKIRARRMRAERAAREEGTAQGLTGDALEAFVTAAGDAALGIG
ncbi:MAG: 4Fe-4S binding protein [Tepidiformaceae bacterium]